MGYTYLPVWQGTLCRNTQKKKKLHHASDPNIALLVSIWALTSRSERDLGGSRVRKPLLCKLWKKVSCMFLFELSMFTFVWPNVFILVLITLIHFEGGMWVKIVIFFSSQFWMLVEGESVCCFCRLLLKWRTAITMAQPTRGSFSSWISDGLGWSFACRTGSTQPDVPFILIWGTRHSVWFTCQTGRQRRDRAQNASCAEQ